MSVQKLQKALHAKQRREVLSESRMRDICLSGSMSGERKRSVAEWPKLPRLSGVRIPSGAPFAYKTTNIPVRGLFTGNHGLQHIPAANNPDGPIVDLDGVDDRAYVGLAGAGIAGVELLIHQPCERIDLG